MNELKEVCWREGPRPISVAQVCEYVGKGWTPLITQLIKDLFAAGWDGEIFQVKEKFGGLRFYVGAVPDGAYELIDKAENDSYHICEVCGQPGELRNDRSWLLTLCDEHNKKDK